MTSAVIVSTARTPLAKSWKGAFNMTHGATLGGFAVRAAVERAGIEAAEVDDVIMGCATPEGATGSNIARQVALRAGLPVTTSGVTVNRFCSSGLQTIAMAAQRVIAGESDVIVAPGLMIGATDSRHFDGVADNIYKFSPVRAKPEDLKRFHGTNERISTANYAELIQFYHQLLRNAAAP